MKRKPQSNKPYHKKPFSMRPWEDRKFICPCCKLTTNKGMECPACGCVLKENNG